MTKNIDTKFGKARMYESPNGWQPSVTSILKAMSKGDALLQWASNCCYNYCETIGVFPDAKYAWKSTSKVATDKGTSVHELAEMYFRSFHSEQSAREFDIAMDYAHKDEEQMVKSLVKWCEKYEIEPIEVEAEIHGNGYSGRVDLIANKKGKKSLIDLKTSKRAYEEYGLQLAAYSAAVPDIEEIGVIRLDKTTHKAHYSNFTKKRERLEKAFILLKDFYWEYCLGDER